MNELQEAQNRIEQEKLQAEQEIEELNDQMYKSKYDDVIRNKFVYQTLLTNKRDAEAKPPTYVPMLLPRRKNLDFVADMPGSDQLNIQLATEHKKNYYDTKTDPVYSTKPLGHDVFSTDIEKQRKDLGT